MELEKFYLDVVTEDGAGAIGYSSRARMMGLSLRPAVLLQWEADREKAPVQQRAVRGRLPEFNAYSLTWNKSPFGLNGKWIRPARHWKEQILWNDGKTRISWQVLAPNSPVTLTQGLNSISGVGYAEILRLRGTPWRLPIDVLRWGRFISLEHNVTWIEWESRKGNRRWLWADSDATIGKFSMGDHSVSWGDYSLSFSDWRTLRSGMLGKTVFNSMYRLSNILPKWIKAMDETKWLARGILTGPDNLEHHGWVIHETVRLR
ncbi:MAG: hypothetical protein LBV12_02655 [Puniceicoccales bacterium]|jgi:hypothetical protein|nr:hypothetical protein [Puniceicoccales bacterium]